jgi:hypothetical protein
MHGPHISIHIHITITVAITDTSLNCVIHHQRFVFAINEGLDMSMSASSTSNGLDSGVGVIGNFAADVQGVTPIEKRCKW